MLNLFDAALAAAKAAVEAGRPTAAVTLLDNLLARPGLPTATAARAHRLAAAVHVSAGRFGRGRTHLRAAAELEPGNAATHYRLGRAFADDPTGCPRKAAVRFKKASELDPTSARYRAALADAAAKCGAKGVAVRAARAAVALAPTHVPTLLQAVDALIAAGRADEAVRLAGKARFAAPKDAGVAKMWDDARFAAAADGQRRDCPRPATRVLPFIRPVGGRTVRADAGSRPTPHLLRPAVRGMRG